MSHSEPGGNFFLGYGVYVVVMMRITAVLLVVALCVGACTSGPEDRSLQVSLESGPECLYRGPARVSPGAVGITFANPLKVEAWVHFVRLDEDRSIDEFEERFDKLPGGGLPEWSDLIWRFPVVDPETTTETEVDVSEGRYAVVCGTVQPDRGYFAGGLTVKG